MRVLSIALLTACSASAPVREPLHAAPAPRLSVEPCNLLGAQQAGRTCAVYDTQKQAFTGPDGTPQDALARRAFLYERWLDLYNDADGQSVVRTYGQAMAPGTPESVFAAADFSWDDKGDSAGFGDTLLLSVLFHYAVTGTDADYHRLETWTRGQLRSFDATGMDGYLARWHFAGVAPGVKTRNGFAMDTYDPNDGNAFDIPQAALPLMPDYYRTGIDGTPVHPAWAGHTSIDAWSGPMNSFPLVWSVLRDPALKARMARHYGCFLKRLRIFKIVNLSKNAELQKDISHYLTSGVLHPDPEDPDLTRVDQIWGFYLPQYNKLSAATYDKSCPAQLAREAAPADVVDATRTGFEGDLLDLIGRQTGDDKANGMDFAFFPSVRAGDAVMLMDYALGAYFMTGDREFLDWRDQVVGVAANGREVSRTIGAFEPPRPCRSYYRTPNVYTGHLMASLIDNDSASRAFGEYLWTKKFLAKEEAGLGDGLFDIQYYGATGLKAADLEAQVADLANFGGAPGHLDDPRRNYAVDLSVHTPPGLTIEKASADELAICSQPITVLGLTINGGSPDPNRDYVRPAPPVSQRPPDNWIWEKSPFDARRTPWDAGHQQYTGLDLLEPYWEARYFGLIPDSHLILAWK